MDNQYEELKQRAKHLVRYHSGNQDLAHKRWKSGEISKEKFIEINSYHEISKKAIQSLFKN